MANYMKQAFSLVSLVLIYSINGGCADSVDDGLEDAVEPTDEAPEGHVKLYYTDVEEGATVVRETVITEDQARAILTARREKRALPKTIGSTDWNNACQFWDWTLVTSGFNGTGSIFCGQSGGTFGGVQIPFVPQFISPSSTRVSALCTQASGTTCYVPCSTVPAGTWRSWWYGSPDQNLNSPAPGNDVRFLNVHEPFWC